MARCLSPKKYCESQLRARGLANEARQLVIASCKLKLANGTMLFAKQMLPVAMLFWRERFFVSLTRNLRGAISNWRMASCHCAGTALRASCHCAGMALRASCRGAGVAPLRRNGSKGIVALRGNGSKCKVYPYSLALFSTHIKLL